MATTVDGPAETGLPRTTPCDGFVKAAAVGDASVVVVVVVVAAAAAVDAFATATRWAAARTGRPKAFASAPAHHCCTRRCCRTPIGSGRLAYDVGDDAAAAAGPEAGKGWPTFAAVAEGGRRSS
jgi:hypothetical protein